MLPLTIYQTIMSKNSEHYNQRDNDRPQGRAEHHPRTAKMGRPPNYPLCQHVTWTF